ncbi:exodeoxyribonuclease VII small subunit [Consotaella salsifontis]|uniref:Exodeoxyribonuclease 7 small subunit n=1 Tax=Consotaella salsifontis TaxID=1365950 RepID=A0A1T4MZ68_9HYPH|nr:exodeoxyribonuclease VII small subunit [Consotaella salsifontis]SJZ72077.1 Exodeoxyribonuclease VII small subunit [Consotaella salsifontis]
MSETTEQSLPADDSDIRRMTFEEALAALERIVADLEHGEVPLDRSIRIYERGEKLKNHCERLLSAAEDRIEKIKLSRTGKPEGTEPLDLG